MSEDRVIALSIALRYVLAEARNQGVDIDALIEAVSETLGRSPVSTELAAQAVVAIEVAADALEV